MDRTRFEAEPESIHSLIACGTVFHDRAANSYFHVSCKFCHSNCSKDHVKFRGLNGLTVHTRLAHRDRTESQEKKGNRFVLEHCYTKAPLTEDDVRRIHDDPSLVQGVKSGKWIDHQTHQVTNQPTGMYMPPRPIETPVVLSRSSQIATVQAAKQPSDSNAGLALAHEDRISGTASDTNRQRIPSINALVTVQQRGFEYCSLDVHPMVVQNNRTKEWFLVSHVLSVLTAS